MPTLREINTTYYPTKTMNNLTEGSLNGAAVLYCPDKKTTTLTTCTSDHVDKSGRVNVACRQNGVFSKCVKFVHDAENGMNKTKKIYQYYQKRRGDYVPSFVQLRKGKYYKVEFDDGEPVETNEVVAVVAEEEGLVGVGNAPSGTAGETTEESSSDDDGNDLSPAQKRQKKSTDKEGGSSVKKTSGNNNDDDDNDTDDRQSGVGAAALDNDDEGGLAEMGKKEEAPNDSASSSVKKRKADDNQVDVSIIVRTIV